MKKENQEIKHLKCKICAYPCGNEYCVTKQTKYELLYYPNPILSEKCEDVVDFNEDLHYLLDEMAKVMVKSNGMGLSANQIGELKNVFIMQELSGKIIEFINPIMLEKSEEKAMIREGCLSSPNVFETVAERSDDVSIRAQDRTGNFFTINAHGIEAVCCQHEMDHLSGIFWFDRFPRQPKRALIRKWDKAREKLKV